MKKYQPDQKKKIHQIKKKSYTKLKTFYTKSEN